MKIKYTNTNTEFPSEIIRDIQLYPNKKLLEVPLSMSVLRIGVHYNGKKYYVPITLKNSAHPNKSEITILYGSGATKTKYSLLRRAGFCVYHSKTESLSDIQEGSIGNAIANGAYYSFPDGVFGKCVMINGNNIPQPGSGDTSFSKFSIIPTPSTQNINKKRGTASFYAFISRDHSSYVNSSVFFGGNRIDARGTTGFFSNGEWGVGILYDLSNNVRLAIMRGAELTASKVIPASGWKLITVLWDAENGLSNGDSVQVFLNEKLELSTKAPIIIPISALQFSVTGSRYYRRDSDKKWKWDKWKGGFWVTVHSYYNYFAHAYLENPKLWNYVDEDMPKKVWNNGSGNQNYV